MSAFSDPARRQILQDEIEKAGFRAIVAWWLEDLVLMAGTWPCLGMNLCLYPVAGDPVYYLSALEPADVCPPGFVCRRFAVDPGRWVELRSVLLADMAALGLQAADIGIAGDGGQHAVTSFSGETPPFGAQAVAVILDGLGVRDATAVFTAAGLRKTPREIERIRRANTVAGAGLAVFRQAAQPGHTEAAIAALVEAAIQTRSGQDGCALARGWAQVQAGQNTHFGGTYSRSSAYRLAKGDLVLLELATCVDGYWSDLTRTTCVGTPSRRQKSLLTAVKDAQEATIAAVRPGISHEELDLVARNFLTDRGFGAGFTHATGHHVGFRYHDRGPTLRNGESAALEPGMVLTIEPGCYGAAFEGGARFEDNVLGGPQKAELLSPIHL